MKLISEIAMKNKLPIKRSFKRKSGDTVIVCDSSETRDSLKSFIASAAPRVETRSPDIRRYTIAVVGFEL